MAAEPVVHGTSVLDRLRGDPARIELLRARLTAWFARERRELPWRRTRDPFAIWVSEAMLQQTRVEAVVEHYRRFLARFPNVQALAAASEDDVVALWSGLGYYNRARTLRKAAVAIVARHGGRFPASAASARALPGVGDYTVGAVLSIAYGQSEALVDGNVARVFARLFQVRDPLEKAGTKRLLWDLARLLVPPAREDDPAAERAPGSWNQALMELGALVCTPRAPRCLVCPLAEQCAGRLRGNVHELPRKQAKRATVEVALEVLLARRGGRVLLVRRPAEGRMARMWELPTRELTGAALWPPDVHGSERGLRVVAGAELLEVRHAITHHRIRAVVRAAEVSGVRGAGAEVIWADAEAVCELGLTGLSRKVLRGLEEGGSG